MSRYEPDSHKLRFGYGFTFTEDYDEERIDKLQQRASEPLETRASEDGNEMIGYASVFGVKDSHGTIIDQGAFTQTMKRQKRTIRVLHNHDSNRVIGKPKQRGGMKQDDYGLYTRSIISSHIGWVADVMEQVRNGDIDGLSIGFWILASKWVTAEGEEKTLGDMTWEEYLTATRHITKVKLAEWSATPFPSNEAARIEQVRSELFDLYQQQNHTHKRLHDGQYVDIEQYQHLESRLSQLQAQLAQLQEHAMPNDIKTYRENAEALRVAIDAAGDECFAQLSEATGLSAQVLQSGLSRESRFMFDDECMQELASQLGVTLKQADAPKGDTIINLSVSASNVVDAEKASALFAQLSETFKSEGDAAGETDGEDSEQRGDEPTEDDKIEWDFELPGFDELKR